MGVFIRKHNKLNLQKIRKPKSFVIIRVLAFLFFYEDASNEVFLFENEKALRFHGKKSQCLYLC